MSFRAGLIPDTLRLDDVVVFFDVVAGVITLLLEQLWIELKVLGEADAAAHVLRAETGGYMPVTIVVRAGAHTGAFDQAFR